MAPLRRLRPLRVAGLSGLTVASLAAQDAVVERPIGDRPTRTPISIGNYPDVASLRLNVRGRADQKAQRVLPIVNRGSRER